MNQKFINFLESLIKGQKIDYYYNEEETEDEKFFVESVDIDKRCVFLKNPKTQEVKPRYEIDFIESGLIWKWI